MKCISNKFQLLNGHDIFDSFIVDFGSSCDLKHSFSVLMKMVNSKFFQNFKNSIATFLPHQIQNDSLDAVERGDPISFLGKFSYRAIRDETTQCYNFLTILVRIG